MSAIASSICFGIGIFVFFYLLWHIIMGACVIFLVAKTVFICIIETFVKLIHEMWMDILHAKDWIFKNL